MAESRQRHILSCIAHDLLIMNPVTRGIAAFAESPRGKRMRRHVAAKVAEAKTELVEQRDRAVRRILRKLTF